MNLHTTFLRLTAVLLLLCSTIKSVGQESSWEYVLSNPVLGATEIEAVTAWNNHVVVGGTMKSTWATCRVPGLWVFDTLGQLVIHRSLPTAGKEGWPHTYGRISHLAPDPDGHLLRAVGFSSPAHDVGPTFAIAYEIDTDFELVRIHEFDNSRGQNWFDIEVHLPFIIFKDHNVLQVWNISLDSLGEVNLPSSLGRTYKLAVIPEGLLVRAQQSPHLVTAYSYEGDTLWQAGMPFFDDYAVLGSRLVTLCPNHILRSYELDPLTLLKEIPLDGVDDVQMHSNDGETVIIHKLRAGERTQFVQLDGELSTVDSIQSDLVGEHNLSTHFRNGVYFIAGHYYDKRVTSRYTLEGIIPFLRYRKASSPAIARPSIAVTNVSIHEVPRPDSCVTFIGGATCVFPAQSIGYEMTVKNTGLDTIRNFTYYSELVSFYCPEWREKGFSVPIRINPGEEYTFSDSLTLQQLALPFTIDFHLAAPNQKLHTDDYRYTVSDISTPVVETTSAPFRIYPNPTTSLLLIETDVLTPPVAVRIFSVEGHPVLAGDIEDGQIDVSGLPAGLYMLIISGGGQSFASRFAKL